MNNPGPVRVYHAFGHTFHIEDWPGHAGADTVGRELADGVVYGLDRLALAPGDTVVDVGAHVGMVALAVSRLHPGVRVLALEPHPATFTLLRRNLTRNGAAGVEPVPLGVSGTPGPIVLRCPTESVGPSAWLGGTGLGSVLAGATTLPALFRRYKISRCAWLKMDCEGGEHEALLACGSAFFARVGRLALEVHSGPRLSAAGFTPARLFAHLDACRARYEVSGTVHFSD